MRRAFYFLLCLFGAGCTLFQPASEGPGLSPQQDALLQKRLQALAPVQSFFLSARLAVTAGNGGWSGALRWEQHSDDFQMNFNAPTGQGALQLQSVRGGVELTLADGRIETADDAEVLLYQQIGLDLPVYGLRYWVMGLPRPGNHPVDKLTFDEQGRITRLQQSGWLVTWPRFRDVNGHQLPRKIVMQNDELNIRLVIDRWEPIDTVN